MDRPMLQFFCELCEYDLRASPGPRCPECGHPFDRNQRLWEEYGIAVAEAIPGERDRRVDFDWRAADISRISSKEYPVRCPQCDEPLSGEGEFLACRPCGEFWAKRRLLWDQHGPEAFRSQKLA